MKAHMDGMPAKAQVIPSLLGWLFNNTDPGCGATLIPIITPTLCWLATLLPGAWTGRNALGDWVNWVGGILGGLIGGLTGNTDITDGDSEADRGAVL